jgi:hypothetical protein
LHNYPYAQLPLLHAAGAPVHIASSTRGLGPFIDERLGAGTNDLCTDVLRRDDRLLLTRV